MTTKWIGIAFLYSSLLFAAPTEVREWTSRSGTTVTASVLSLSKGQVTMKLENGKTVKLAVGKLSDDDQAFLAEHFDGEDSEAAGDGVKLDQAITITRSKAEPITEGLPQPVGEVVGPIDAGSGATYFLYIPTTLKKGRLAPLMHYNGSGGGSAHNAKEHIVGAEATGMIVAISVESKNLNRQNPVVVKADLEHLQKTLPVDKNRIYFTGGSGGGACSFVYFDHYKSAGTMPHIAHSGRVNLKGAGGHHFLINGTTDYNRYSSAVIMLDIGKNATQRYFVGPHQSGPEWLNHEGMVWLNGMYLMEKSKDEAYEDERLDYEAGVIDWIQKMAKEEPRRAYSWCHFLIETYKIDSENTDAVKKLAAALAKVPGSLQYVEGIKDIEKFSMKFYGEFQYGSIFDHTTPKIQRASERMVEKYAAVPEIAKVFKGMGEKSCGK